MQSDNSEDSNISFEIVNANAIAYSGDEEEYMLVIENTPSGSGTDRHEATYDEVFSAIGFGRWHYLLLLQCGWANASDAIEIMCISFTISSIHDSLQLTSPQLMWLTIMLFLGMMVGGYFWGSLADSWGRRKIVIFSLAINGCFGVASAFAKTYWVILLLRFFSGIGAGGSLPVCFTYFSEFQPKDKRGAMISALATFWMAGNLLTAGLAWAILPEERHMQTFSPFGESWRLFIIVCALPSLSSSLIFILMPESPKFLMKKGKTFGALKVLKQIYLINNCGRSPFPYSNITTEMEYTYSLINENYHQQSVMQTPIQLYVRRLRHQIHCSCSSFTPKRICKSVQVFFISIGKSMKHQVSVVCSGTAMKKTTFLMIMIYFAIAFGGYGMSMWLPTILERAEQLSGSICSQPIAHNSSSQVNKSGSSQVYIDVLIGSAAQLPANIFTIFVMDVIGGKTILVSSFFLSAVTVLFFWMVSNHMQVLIMNALFNAVSTMVWNGLDVITPEMYDTSVRASANGFLTAISRIASILGNVVFGLFVDTNCTIPLLTVCVVLLIGGIASLFIPNTRSIDLS